jgi:hypothetical protein
MWLDYSDQRKSQRERKNATPLVLSVLAAFRRGSYNMCIVVTQLKMLRDTTIIVESEIEMGLYYFVRLVESHPLHSVLLLIQSTFLSQVL